MSPRDLTSPRRSGIRGFVLAAAAIAILIAPIAANAQSFIKCPPFGQPLLKIKEIDRNATTKKLDGVMEVTDQDRIVWFPSINGSPEYCAAQHLRYFDGYKTGDSAPAPAKGPQEPMPGPTLRARVGDLVQLSFFNEINLTNFPSSQYFDRDGCDETAGIYPSNKPAGAIDDKYPNCFHGSSTANVHFHGTHTNPGSTGDNVLLQIRPTPRVKGKPVVDKDTFKESFQKFFADCAVNLATKPSYWPTHYKTQMPKYYRDKQEELLKKHDEGLKEPQKLWPQNEEAIEAGAWPQYYIGAYPTCYQLPEYPEGETPAVPPDPRAADPKILQMGQAPGTMWYHMHKHGSTTLNVNNTLIGAFIIEGKYDDQLMDFYKTTATNKNWWDLDEKQKYDKNVKVMVIQQVSVTPNLERAAGQGRPIFSVNGRRQPVVTMHPGEVQMWRIINGPARSGSYLVAPAPSATSLQWVQIAQDGVQFNPKNYHPPAAGAASQPIMMSAGNRVDLLVRVPPGATGSFTVQVYDVVKATELPTANQAQPKTPEPLVTVNVVSEPGKDPDPAMPFISAAAFPTMPAFLPDSIPDSSIFDRKELTFNSSNRGSGANHTINNNKFGDGVDQIMLLNTNEEWTIINTTADTLDKTKRAQPGAIMHPFHIHINPFQVVELFDPWNPVYVFTKAEADANPTTKCYLNPDDKTTWHPCDLTKLSPPYIWWDVFGMPGGIKVLDSKGATVTIPGYFKFRSRFSDYPGQYVLHCHILAHEDRGMMQLIEVVPNKTVLKHH
jgi:FtsP/CotA-like multicopper oxidase with cupredoxin domain